MAKKYKDFLDALGFKESSDDYEAENKQHYLGRYQMGEAALIESGNYTRDNTPRKNDYKGTWTGKDGINSKQDFLGNPDAQDKAVQAFHGQVWKQIVAYGLDDYVGKIVGGVKITESGLIAGAHLGGIGKLKQYIESNGKIDLTDGNGVPVSEYVQKFGGYEIDPVKGLDSAQNNNSENKKPEAFSAATKAPTVREQMLAAFGPEQNGVKTIPFGTVVTAEQLADAGLKIPPGLKGVNIVSYDSEGKARYEPVYHVGQLNLQGQQLNSALRTLDNNFIAMINAQAAAKGMPAPYPELALAPTDLPSKERSREKEKELGA